MLVQRRTLLLLKERPRLRLVVFGTVHAVAVRPVLRLEVVQAWRPGILKRVNLGGRRLREAKLGVDEVDQYDHMLRFVDIVSEAPCARFSIHARKAWLSGLSPKQNRNVPPLRYDEVYRLKQERPDLTIEINGGIQTVAAMRTHLEHVDGVMIGRAAYDNPMIFAEVDRQIYGASNTSDVTDFSIAEQMLPYAERWIRDGGRLHHISRHMLALFQGQPGARMWRRTLTEAGSDPTGSADPLKRALDFMANRTFPTPN